MNTENKIDKSTIDELVDCMWEEGYELVYNGALVIFSNGTNRKVFRSWLEVIDYIVN